jgi:hypothetical protein
MGLVININGKILRGDEQLLFTITHKNEKMSFKIYRDGGHIRMFFDASRDFKIDRENIKVQNPDDWILE